MQNISTPAERPINTGFAFARKSIRALILAGLALLSASSQAACEGCSLTEGGWEQDSGPAVGEYYPTTYNNSSSTLIEEYTISGDFNASSTPTQVEVAPDEISTRLNLVARNASTQAYGYETPYGQAYAEWTWHGSPGTSCAIPFEVDVDISGYSLARVRLMAYSSGTSAEGETLTENLVYAYGGGGGFGGEYEPQAYGYQANGGTPILDAINHSDDATLTSVVLLEYAAGIGDDSDVDAAADFAMSFNTSYCSSAGLSEVSANVLVHIIHLGVATTTRSGSPAYEPVARSESRTEIDGHARVTLF